MNGNSNFDDIAVLKKFFHITGFKTETGWVFLSKILDQKAS